MKTNKEGEIKSAVSRERNISLYETLLNRLNLPSYQGAGPIVSYKNALEKGKENFINLSTLNQAKELLQILRFFRCNAEQSDLSLIGGPSIIGRIAINNDITDVDFRIVSYSPCGLTVREKKI